MSLLRINVENPSRIIMDKLTRPSAQAIHGKCRQIHCTTHFVKINFQRFREFGLGFSRDCVIR